MPRSPGPPCVVVAGLHSLAFNVHSVHNTASNNRATQAPHIANSIIDVPSGRSMIKSTGICDCYLNKCMVKQNLSYNQGNTGIAVSESVESRTSDCFAAKNVQNLKTESCIKYVFRWYGYSAKYDIVKLQPYT